MCRVLIIDDEQFSAETIKIILDESGEAKADYSTSYEEARELVKQALKSSKPYEVFLIDQRLGPGKDGIEVMQELRGLSPDSDAIIFTGLEDTENGVRAYEAGAFRYLSKPFENRELLFLLKALKQWRKEQQEHDWQKLFTSMMEEALRKTSFSEAGEVVVKYALKLGFSRAHLFWVPTQEDANPDNLMIGIASAGRGCIPHFSGSRADRKLYPLKQWFDLNRAKKAHEVIFFDPNEANLLQQQAEAMGYRWPKGEIAFLPLWGSNRVLGELMLDHGQGEKTLSKHEFSLLNLFARQVAIVLENASLISREMRTVQETTTISQIGRQVTDRAVEETNLSRLFNEVRRQISFLMDVSNFLVVLNNPESRKLEVSLWYEKGVRQDPLYVPASLEIEKFLLSRDNGFFWQQGVAEQLQKNDLSMDDAEIPTSCIGVQLRVGKNIIGGIVARNYDAAHKFTKRDNILLLAVASQISGSIQLIYLNEAEKRDTERLNVLRQAMMEMLRIGQEKEDDLWLTTLTIATANFGLGFNRALLFLENEEHTVLNGENGVGTNDPAKAHQDWENTVDIDYQFDQFLAELESGTLRLTEFHDLAREITIPLNGDNNAFTQVLKSGHPVLIEEGQAKNKLPSQLRKKITPSTCAVLPILTGSNVVGLVLVDNKHNGLPLNEKMLNHLQTLLNYTGLVWEILRQQEKSNHLLDANYDILSSASPQSLKYTLDQITQTAYNLTEADWVIIYPLQEGLTAYDIPNISSAGKLHIPLENVVKEKPRKRGVAAHVLEYGELVVNNIDSEDENVKRLHLVNHHFIQRENVKALIGITVQDPLTKQKLGVLYLDYREPRYFSAQEIHHARSFASLAAVAISNARRYHREGRHQRMMATLETAAIANTEIDMDQMLQRVLENLKRLFDEPQLCVLAYDRDENSLRFVQATLKFYRAPKSKINIQHAFPLDGPSIACEVARRSLKLGRAETINEPDVSKNPDYLQIITDSRSELCRSLVGSSHELLGVLVLERPSTYGFSEDDQALIETVANQLSLGIERIHQSEQLSFVTAVATLTSWAADTAHDINNEAEEIQGRAYLIKEMAQGNKEIIKQIKLIEESAHRLFESGPKSMQGKQAINLDLAIRNYAEPLARQRGIEIEFQLDAEGQFIFVYPTNFRRVLQHLTRNADRAMKDMPHKKVCIQTSKTDNNELEILFSDFGPGVSEDVQLSIFKKRVTTKEKTRSDLLSNKSGFSNELPSAQIGGIGLLLTRLLVEDMKGTIRLLPSKPGVGATFSIKLPITQFKENGIE